MTDSIHTSSWSDSLWRETAEAESISTALTNDVDTEVLIVGAGYTGLSTALHLAEQVKEIVVIDQAQPGWGCSGRNGGHINPNWKTSLEQLGKLYSSEELKLFIATINESADLVFNIVEKFNIKCHAQHNGCLIATKGIKGKSYLADWVSNWQILKADVELLDEQATSTTIGTEFYDHCLLDRRGGSLQPLSYAQGLARACNELGISIFGNTPALAVNNSDKGWEVKTPKGNITCRKLVLATNGYTDNLWPGLAQSLIPVASMLTATEPLPSNIAKTIMPGREPVAEYMGVPFYYRIDESDRLVFGGRGTISGSMGSLNTQHLKSKAVSLFPELEAIQWQFDWAGYVGITAHQQPMLIQLDKNAFAGLGFNGRGITMATSMGKQLAALIKGEPPSLPIRNLEQIPLHQFHKLGVAARILSGYVTDYFR
ncbi:MAG: glycine/D-amino acid oxidase-like deaminating enzyme [Parasphingorhabdus sp.]|jgi:glycine/D-amino acid oxidase-like deaminating enzyme